MTREEFNSRISLIIMATGVRGCYDVAVRGFMPDDEMIILDLEIEECFTQEVLMDTIQAELEEVMHCKYSYGSDEPIDESLLYDGGNFNESN